MAGYLEVLDPLRHCKGDRWITKFIKANRNQDYAFATAAFYKYRAAGSLYPPAPSPEANLGCNGKEEGGREFGSPFLASLYNFVCGLPESERALHGDSAFDFPLGFATFLYYSKLELDGNMRVENAREAQFKNEFKSAVNAILKEKVENG